LNRAVTALPAGRARHVIVPVLTRALAAGDGVVYAGDAAATLDVLAAPAE